MKSRTHYVKSGDVHIAYQVAGWPISSGLGGTMIHIFDEALRNQRLFNQMELRSF